MIDPCLLNRIRAGDRGAIAELAVACRPLVLRHLARWRLSREDREDLCQDAMVLVLRNIETFEGRADIGTWVFRIVHNLVIDAEHRRQRRPRLDGAVDPDAQGSPVAADSRVTSKEIVSALDRLTPSQREAFVGRHALGMRIDEIARDLGSTEPSVRAMLHKTKRRLKAALSPRIRQCASAAGHER